MKRPNRLIPPLAGLALAATGILAGPLGGASPAGAAPGPSDPGDPGPAVFVQTDNAAGNQVVAFTASVTGQLLQDGTYDTGGLGGSLTGSVVDHLASQGSLAYDQVHQLLYAVNAGSDSVSVFSVRGDRLALRQIVPSGGAFPVSVAVHDDSVEVLNAENGGSVSGFFSFSGRLVPLPGSTRPLGLDPTATPQFTHTPGQVAFSPDGSQLIVTTKANGSDIDVFAVGPFGWLSQSPVVNAEPGAVPFAVTFDQGGHLVVAEAGTNSVATFALTHRGTVSPLDVVATGQAATCWVAPADGFLYASNAGSGTVSELRPAWSGELALVGTTATDPGTVDAAASADGRFLYVQTGADGIVDSFQIGAGGTLTRVGSVTVAGAVGGEGIAAS
ncbi:MAG: lactonase family protein [Acidimicrobiales bacterium]|jgi:6-phosphogluconolactonase (cycloisomerase 2 family)